MAGVSVTSSEWQWFSQRYSQVRPSKSTSTFSPYPPFLDKKNLFLFSQRRFINQWDRVSVRNCSVQSFFKWDIILSRWLISLTKRGQCWYFAREAGLTACLAAAVREGVSNWMSEWTSEWVIEWRTRADNMLTDWQREATAISIDPATQTPSFGRWLLHRPPGHSQMLDYQPAWLHLWAIFYLIQYKVLVFELSHNIPATYGDCFFFSLWSGGLGWSQNFFKCAGKYQKILNISYCIHVVQLK